MKLRAKILLIVGLPLLLAYAVYISTDYTRGREQAFNHARATLSELTGHYAALIDVRFSNMSGVADTLARLIASQPPRTLEAFVGIDRAILEENPDIASATLAYEPHAYNLNQRFFSASVFRANSGGKETLVPKEALNGDYAWQDWFLQPKLSLAPFWAEPYFEDVDSVRLMCSYSSPLITDGVFQGVLSVETSIEHIINTLSELKVEGGYGALVSRTGGLIAHPDPKMVIPVTLRRYAEENNLPELRQFAEALPKMQKDGIIYMKEFVNRGGTFVGYARVPSTGWFFLGIVEEDLVLAPILARLRTNMILLAGSAVLLFLLIYLLASYQITRPLQTIAAAARRIAGGDLETPVPMLRQRDEIGDLATAFNTMQSNLQQHIAGRVEESTARKMAEEANQAKNEFLSNMSHELRTPLNAVIGMAYLTQNTPLNTQQEKYVRQIHTAAKSMLAIINDIFDFSTMEASKLKLNEAPFFLEQAVADASLDIADRCREKGLEFQIAIAENVPRHLIGDAARLGQILGNFLDNAVKFTERGSVILSCEPASPPEPPKAPADSDAVSLLFTIRDTGIGISPEFKERLFTAFTQADASSTRKHGGIGLGLSISRHLINLMNGEVSLESQEGQGTAVRFTVRLRLDPEYTAALPSASSDALPDAAPMATLLPPAASLEQELETLERLLAEDDAQAVNAFSTLEPHLQKTQPEAHALLRQAMDSFDFEQALRLTRDLLKQSQPPAQE